MADKPRVKAPKQRASTSSDGRSSPAREVGAAIAGVVLGVLVVAAFSARGRGSSIDPEAVRRSWSRPGARFQSVKALEATHSIEQPGGTSDQWNTDPPTNGPHYGIAAIFGIYEDELELARVVHNLEHGGIFILYGDEVPDATVDELRDVLRRPPDGHHHGAARPPR